MKHLYSLVAVQLGITAWLCSTLSSTDETKYLLIFLLAILQVVQLLQMINSSSFRKLVNSDEVIKNCKTCHDENGNQFIHDNSSSQFTGWYKSYDGKLVASNYCPDCGRRLTGNQRSSEGMSLKNEKSI